MPFELLVLREGEVSHAIPLSDAPLQVGRAPGSHIAIADGGVSWHHAQIWGDAGEVWVRDLGSRNGTFVNDNPVGTPTIVRPDDVIRIAPRISLQLREVPEQPSGMYEVRYVEDVHLKVRFLVAGERFHIGAGADAHLRVDDAPDRAATLTLHPDGEMWLGTSEGEFELPLGQTFEVAGRTMRVVLGKTDHLPTVDFGMLHYPYKLVVNAQGLNGPEARVTDQRNGTEWFTGGNRGVLLFLLVRQLVKDADDGVPVDDRGWMGDNEVTIGIWGKSGGGKTSLNVLVHRVRQQLERAGLDPWFIEKRRGGIRARLRDVEVLS